jgi:hypothetical protein
MGQDLAFATRPGLRRFDCSPGRRLLSGQDRQESGLGFLVTSKDLNNVIKSLGSLIQTKK